jgi:hypothetical protein
MLKYIFHIGSPKTGTSSIRQCLNQNDRYLAGIGYGYFPPKGPVGKNYRLFFKELNKCKKSDIIDKIVTFFDEQEKECLNNKCNELIISDEWLITKKAIINDLFSVIDPKNVRILFYVRRQDHYLESAWKQWHYKDVNYSDFSDYVKRYKVPNWYNLLKKWSKYIEKERINVIPFEKDSFPDGLLPHFFQQIGLSEKQVEKINFPVPGRGWGENRSFSREVLDIMFLSRELSEGNINDHKIQRLISLYLNKNYQKEFFAGTSLLTTEMRCQTIEQYKDINKKMAKEFLNRKNGILFKENITEENNGEHYQGLSIEALVKFFMNLAYNQAQVIDELKEDLDKVKQGILKKEQII